MKLIIGLGSTAFSQVATFLRTSAKDKRIYDKNVKSSSTHAYSSSTGMLESAGTVHLVAIIQFLGNIWTILV